MSVRASLSPLGGDLFAVHFDLVNDGAAAVEVPAYEPFLDFSIAATVGGTSVPVLQPALDIGLQPTTITVPGHAGARLDTPIRLRIAAGAEAGTDGFVWTIAHRLDDLRLRAALDLPVPFGGETGLSPA